MANVAWGCCGVHEVFVKVLVMLELGQESPFVLRSSFSVIPYLVTTSDEGQESS